LEGRQPYRELTAASLIGGVLVGIVLNVGIVFAGMQIGFTIVGSTVGAILGFGFLRGVLRKGSILEVNVFQTVASSVNIVNAGIIFTVPVLFLLGRQQEIDYSLLLLATISGSLLGVVMIIPLRKQIIEYERLRFPSAVGVAAILKSPGAGKRKAALLLVAVAVSAALTALALDWSTMRPLDLWLFELDLTLEEGEAPATLLPASIPLGEAIGFPAGFRLVLAMSLLTFGAGYLAGRPGLVVLYGTLLNYWFLIPATVSLGWLPPLEEPLTLDVWGRSEEAYAGFGAFAEIFRKYTSSLVGIGMILGGAIAGVFIALPALKAAFASLRGGARSGSGRMEEVPFRVLGICFALGLVGLLFAAKATAGDALGLAPILLAVLASIVWMWLAGLVVAQTTGRTDWSPLSGLALLAVAIAMGILGTSDDAILPAVTIGAIAS